MKGKRTRALQIMPVALAGMLVVGHSQAETSAQKREKQLQQLLKNSEDREAALQKRIEQLESRVQALGEEVSAVKTSPATPITPVTPQPPNNPAQTSSTPSKPASPSKAQAQQAGQSAARSGPGAFEVDEAAAQRALERTLTQSGALLLPQNTFEITPSYIYQRNEQNLAALVPVGNPAASPPTQVVANLRNRFNENIFRLDVRAGLPYNSQLEIGLPYNYVRTSQVSDLGTGISANGKGIGDATLGIAKTLARESGLRPDLVGRFTYNFGNGKQQDGLVALYSGFRQMTAELIALKRQDPLAFVASAYYSKTFEKDGIKPGDGAGVSLSATLAASPATSLQLGFSQVYRKNQKNFGVTQDGSDQTYGIATFGATSVLSRDLSLVTQLGIGMGNDAPKYSFTISLPILFR